VETLSLPIATVVRDNVAVLLTYAFSREPLRAWANDSLQGEFDQLRHTMFELPTHRAERACLELAVLLRYLDDNDQISDHYAGYSQISFGYLDHGSGDVSALTIRDVTNKIIHAIRFDWDFARPNRPFLICVPRDPERWTRASVDVAALCVVCGQIVG